MYVYIYVRRAFHANLRKEHVTLIDQLANKLKPKGMGTELNRLGTEQNRTKTDMSALAHQPL